LAVSGQFGLMADSGHAESLFDKVTASKAADRP
jgi:hypothetical protein